MAGMNNEAHTCPDCRQPIPVNAPQGLCPKCLMSGAAAPTETGTLAETRPKLPAPSVEEIAHAFPQLQIIGLIGRGGMGFVYRARQPRLERDVALKILPQHLAAHPGFAERFAREGKVLAKLNHPNIVSIFDFGESGGFFFLLMEFVDGVNLRQAMRASRFTPAQALAIVPAICEALQFAHDEGVLHRDIKPENILLDAKGRVKIADFGIAKLMGEGRATFLSPSGTDDRKANGAGANSTLPDQGQPDAGATGMSPFHPLTAVSSTLGTPQYMAPEQIEHPSEVDHRADIYSLGVVFYELLTGELPIGKFAPPSAKTPISERVDEIVMRALAKERELRQQSAGELKTQVETAAAQSAQAAAQPRLLGPAPNPWPHRLFWLIVGPLALLIAAVIAGFLAPALQLSIGNSAGLIAGLVPVLTGALLVWLFFSTRPSGASSTAGWNPWPKRIFWLLVLLVIVPAMAIVLGLLVPGLFYIRQRASLAALEERRAVDAAAKIETTLYELPTLIAAPAFNGAAGSTVDLVPAVVVQTEPASGAGDVAAGVRDLRVRFSKTMTDQSWSWSEAWPGSVPELIGSPQYDAERRTCTVKAKLEPGRTYACWLNSERFTNFKDTNGNPAVPYLLIFQTQGKPESP